MIPGSVHAVMHMNTDEAIWKYHSANRATRQYTPFSQKNFVVKIEKIKPQKFIKMIVIKQF